MQVNKLKKDGDVGEDAAANLEDVIQELTDDYVKKLDKVAAAKSEELTTI